MNGGSRKGTNEERKFMLKTKLTGLLAAALSPARRLRDGPDHRRRRQELHRAADHGGNDRNQLLKAKGFKTDKRAGLGSAALRQAQEAGQVDVYWEYTGTSLITYNKVTDKLDAAATYAKVKELDGAKGLVWLNPSKANNTYALAMRKADAQAKGIKSLSDLAGKSRAAKR